MPARGYPLDISAIILCELARGPGSGPEVLRRARERMSSGGYKLNYGSWYPALKKLTESGLIAVAAVSAPGERGPGRTPEVYFLRESGKKAAREISDAIRALILPPEATA